MIYTELTRKAMKIAFEAHKNQTDKSGIPYIYHPIHLAEQMTDEKTACVALLHDVAEDTDITFEELTSFKGIGTVKAIQIMCIGELSKRIACTKAIHKLRLMTHDKSVPYMDYVKEIKKNPIAAKVKLADLKHNSDLTRLNEIDEKAKARAKKYTDAIELLST